MSEEGFIVTIIVALVFCIGVFVGSDAGRITKSCDLLGVFSYKDVVYECHRK